MVKPLLGKSVRSDWFFLGRSNQNSEKEMWILSFFMKLPEKAKKIETFLRFQRWKKT